MTMKKVVAVLAAGVIAVCILGSAAGLIYFGA